MLCQFHRSVELTSIYTQIFPSMPRWRPHTTRNCVFHRLKRNKSWVLTLLCTGRAGRKGCVLETNTVRLCFNYTLVAGHPLDFTFTNVCLFFPPLSLSNHFHRFQNPIIAKWLPLLFHQLRPKSDISTDACKENCPCGKTSKPPHCSGRPCDSAWLPVGRINPGVRIFSLPQLCCCLIGSKTVENVSVLRKGE